MLLETIALPFSLLLDTYQGRHHHPLHQPVQDTAATHCLNQHQGRATTHSTMALRTTDPNEVRFAGHNGRNSSRVLAPPGGASSFSFADMGSTPAPAQKVECQAHRAESHAYDGWANQSPIHKTKVVDPQNQRGTPIQEATNKPVHGKHGNKIHMAHPLSTVEGKSREVHTSSRVLAPPGGRCHNIFG